MDKIDFRSDTVSWPTPRMKEAMATAPIGDDVYGEDPTVNELERLAAAKVGKEAAVFVTSGTQGNLLGVLSHAQRGDEVILGRDSHIALAEAGGVSVLGGVAMRQLATDQYGKMDLAEVETAVRANDPHYPISRLIAVENSYGTKFGYPISPDYYANIRAIAQRHNMSVHMDGARLFNSAVAQNIDAREITQHVDSVTFCLSKGLSAPVGSVLCGSADLIQRARRLRKLVGGSMRQAGVVAAAGVVALHEMIERLADDHDNARTLAEGLATIPGIDIDVDMVRTNIVFFDLAADAKVSSEELVARLQEKANIWVGGGYGRRFRAVTHYWITPADVDLFLNTVRQIL
ncbi:MAG: low-specificity L-threonine aldolase [Anaerolineales bacterium]|nr:low-specificity L-threonine aldolase [Anaerolineales bacterium]